MTQEEKRRFLDAIIDGSPPVYVRLKETQKLIRICGMKMQNGEIRGFTLPNSEQEIHPDLIDGILVDKEESGETN